MDLHYRDLGHGDPLIVLHGLYGSGDNWYSIARKLEDSNHIFLLDQRNHGKSFHDDEMNYDLLSEDLMIFICRQALRRINLLGHSMGGKVAMTFANRYPHMINKLIVADISPRSYRGEDESTPQAFFHKNTVKTLMDLDIQSAKSREEIDEELSNEIKIPAIRSFLLKNVIRSEDGVFSWQINLKAIRNNLDNIFDRVDLTDVNPTDEFKALFIKGEKSGYLNEFDKEIIPEYYSDFRFEIISDAGHWLHAEKPEEFSELVKRFLKS